MAVGLPVVAANPVQRLASPGPAGWPLVRTVPLASPPHRGAEWRSPPPAAVGPRLVDASLPVQRALAEPPAPGRAGGGWPGRGDGTTTAPPPGPGSAPSQSLPETPAGSAGAASGLAVDDLVDRVLRKLTRQLAVEGERRGWRRWP